MLKDLHQRTWELELLISGAVAFALAQVPARVDRAYARLEVTLSGGSDLLAFLAYYYLKLILYTLLVAFLTHLVVRAFWVSLVGLDSVFPRGVRWNRLRQGPNTLRVYRRHLPSVRELIVRSDGLASVIFAGTFSLVGVFLVSVMGAGLLSGLALLVTSVLPVRVSALPVVMAAAIGLSLWLTLPPLVDRFVGPRLAADGRVARTLRAIIAANARLSGLTVYGPIQFTLGTHVGTRRASGGVLVAMLVLVAFFIVNDVLVRQDRLVFQASPWLALETGDLGVTPRYYEDQRGDAHLAFPSIPSEMVEEDRPWVRLFVPFLPEDDDAAVERLCPGLPPFGDGGLALRRRVAPPDSLRPRLTQTLDCLARLWVVRLDGQEIGADPVFMEHPTTGIRGMAYFLDARQMVPGRHVVTLTRAAGARELYAEGPPERHEILFWR